VRTEAELRAMLVEVESDEMLLSGEEQEHQAKAAGEMLKWVLDEPSMFDGPV